MKENKMPKNWTKVSLEQLFNLKYGKGLAVKNLLDEGYSVYGANGIIGKYKTYHFENSKIIISCRGAASGTIHKTKPKSFITSNSIVLDEIDDEILNIDYLKYAMIIVNKDGVITGTAQPQITIQLLKNLEVILAPRPEQDRIVAKVDALMEQVSVMQESLQRIPQLLKDFRQQVLTQAVTGKLTEEWREGRNLGKWKFTNLDYYCESSFYGPRFGKKDYTSKGFPTLRTTDMTDNGTFIIDESVPKVKITNQSKIQLYKVEKGDLLITRTGSIGKMARYFGSDIVIPSAYLIRFRFKENAITDFIYYSLSAPISQREMGLNSTAITQPNLNAKKIRNIQIPLLDTQEQKLIIEHIERLFSKADAIQQQYEALKQKIDTLPQAILHKAFKGELVEQLESDGSAEDLLREIEGLKI